MATDKTLSTTTTATSSTTTMKAISALNVYKKVPVIRRPSDALTYEDTEGNQKTITDLGEAVSLSTPMITAKAKHDIPVPRITLVESYSKDVPPTYQIPASYVRYVRPTHVEIANTLEYVADAEDEIWLQQNSKFGGSVPPKSKSDDGSPVTTEETISSLSLSTAASQRCPSLSLEMLEHMLDYLDKATGFEAIITLDQAERLILSKMPQIYRMYPIKARSGVVTIKHVLHDVYQYWVQKRSKLKRPLLRRFWPVTSTDDTNPHLVFRPREKEKYKLRKKRQNDMDAYRKMKQLKSDFDNLRALLELVKRREELNRSLVQLHVELFRQRLYDLTDTSGWPRLTTLVDRDELDRKLDVPRLFETQEGSNGAGGGNNKRSKKRRRGIDDADDPGARGASGAGFGLDKDVLAMMRNRGTAIGGGGSDPGTAEGIAASGRTAIVAGSRNGSEPAPLFLHPLASRESYTTSWEHAVPHVTSYVNSHASPTFRFRHRPRVGRGGRLCIDRIPHPAHPNVTPMTVLVAGGGLPRSIRPKERLLDLLPPPLDYASLSRRIEEICVGALKDDTVDTASGGAIASAGASSMLGAVGDAENNDCEEVLVKLDDWLDTDDQLWGEERFAPIGPL